MLKVRDWRGVSNFVALALCACGTEKATGPSAPANAEIIVSAPIPLAFLPGGAGQSGSVVFVSAMPQAVLGAAVASVSGEDGLPATTSVRNGGFDPVAVAAASGDVVSLSLTDSGGATKAEKRTVRSGRPPRVVRTSPAPHRTDVPLNAVIRVVFSSPVDLASARSAITLTTGGGPVPGTIEAVETNVIAVDFVATAGVLAPETSYRLEVTAEVHDVLGQALVAPVSVEFRTGTSTNEAVARLDIYHPGIVSGPCCLAAGLNLDLRVGDPAVAAVAYAWSADGVQLRVPISWQSDDPAVARVSQDAKEQWAGHARVTGVGRGRTKLVARHGSLIAALRIMAWEEVPAATFAGYRLVIADGKDLVALNGDGSGRTTLTSVPSAYSPSAGPDGRIAFSSGRVPSGWDFMSDDGIPLTFVPEGALSIRSVEGTISALSSGDGAAICPAWSPDGTQIAFTRSLHGNTGGELVVRSADGSAERTLFALPGVWADFTSGNQFNCPQWSPNGERISIGVLPFSIRPDGTDSVPLFPAIPEEEVPYCGGCHMALLAGPWSPDGRTMLTTDHSVFGLRDLVSGIAWVGGEYFIGAAAWSPDGAVFAIGTRWLTATPNVFDDGLWLIKADGTQRARVPGAAAFYGVTFAR